MDFIVELPDSHGFDAIMVVVDSVTKRPHFIPTNTMVSSEGAAQLYYSTSGSCTDFHSIDYMTGGPYSSRNS